MNVFVYFSKPLNRPVIGKSGRQLGILFDLAVESGQVLPQACTLLIVAMIGLSLVLIASQFIKF